MNVLVLVQSTEKQIYNDLLKAQQETWDSVDHPNITVIYYKASDKADILEGNTLYINNPDILHKMFSTFAKSLRHLRKMDWDYIVKTDNSAYINKQKLYELLLTKPRENYYGGALIKVEINKEGHSRYDQYFMWGECFIMSRDVAMRVVESFNKAPLKSGPFPEDIVVGIILTNKCVWDSTLEINNPNFDSPIEPDKVVYRARTINKISPTLEERDDLAAIIESDIKMMYKIHKSITNGQTNNREGILEEAQDKA